MWVILLKKTKLTELENLIPAALTTVENKILSVSDLVKKKQKINLMIIIMINILLLQSLIN